MTPRSLVILWSAVSWTLTVSQQAAFAQEQEAPDRVVLLEVDARTPAEAWPAAEMRLVAELHLLGLTIVRRPLRSSDLDAVLQEMRQSAQSEHALGTWCASGARTPSPKRA